MSEPHEQDRQFANAFGGDIRYWAWQWIYSKFQATPEPQVVASDSKNANKQNSTRTAEQATERPSVYLLPPPKNPVNNIK
jgi:hypothetical protein